MIFNTEDFDLMVDFNSQNVSYQEGWGVSCRTVDDCLIQSICDQFHNRTDVVAHDSMWYNITNKHAAFINHMRTNDLLYVKDHLEYMFMNPLTDGTVQGEYHHTNLLEYDETRKMVASYTYNKLMLLMQYVELIPIFYPENRPFINDFENYFSRNPNIHLNSLKSKLKIDVSAPKYSLALFGIQTKYGLYSWRDFISFGIAAMINERYDNKEISICEIGGGVGHLAYYLRKFGFNKISIIDLPTISATQMYFLGVNDEGHNIKFLSPDQYDGDYDLILNVDSMTEMNMGIVDTYIKKMDKRTRLISINHEINTFRVSSVCRSNKLKRLQRHPFWFRKGYNYEEYVRT